MLVQKTSLKQAQRRFQMCVQFKNNLLQVQTKNNLKMDVPRENNLIGETRAVKLKPKKSRSHMQSVTKKTDVPLPKPAMKSSNKS